jgi:hypothetical protein
LVIIELLKRYQFLERGKMGKHILFVLKPGFYDGEAGPFYCPHSAAIEGILKYLPEIVEKVDVRRIDFQRPREEVIALIGEENQGSPVLVLDEQAEVPPEAQVYPKTGRAFIHDEIKIGNFLSQAFGVMRPH